MKNISMKSVFLIMGLGMSLSGTVNAAKTEGDGPNCLRLYEMCATGHTVSCNRFAQYC